MTVAPTHKPPAPLGSVLATTVVAALVVALDTYMLGLILFALASTVCALASNVGVLITARTLQGAGGAMLSPTALALLTAATQPAKRGAIMGIYAAAMGLAVIGGPLVGGGRHRTPELAMDLLAQRGFVMSPASSPLMRVATMTSLLIGN